MFKGALMSFTIHNSISWPRKQIVSYELRTCRFIETRKMPNLNNDSFLEGKLEFETFEVCAILHGNT